MRLVKPVVIAATVAAFAATATASIVLRVTPRELADEAHVVVEGRVSAIDVRWDDKHTAINHYVTFNVEQVHKGKAGASVTIVVPGGTVGDETLRVDGVPTFKDGERAVVFLWKNKRGELVVLGQAQGKFNLFHDKKTKTLVAQNSLKGLCLVMRGGPKAVRSPRATRPDYLAHQDLVNVVKASVRAEQAKTTGGNALPSGGGSGSTTTDGSTPDGTGTGGTTGTGDLPDKTDVPPTGDGSTGGATVPGGGAELPGKDRDQAPGQDPATPEAQPNPPTTNPSNNGAPPPSKDDPAPPTGK
ncbi:MAG: hypothetical protein ACYTDX_01660 [Planctomycetota bacterium]|jgi:hypothetical protein